MFTPRDGTIVRMRLAHAFTTLAVGLAALAGCARTEAFDIGVRNGTREPVTLVLTKNGPPYERLWAAPEDLAVESPDNDEQHSFVVLAPDRQADVALTGRFDQGSRGFLRVYRGDLDISDLSAIGPASPNRVDLPLRPGVNRFSIVDRGGRLAAARPTAEGP